MNNYDNEICLPDRSRGQYFFNSHNSEIAEEARFPSRDIYDCITNKCYNVRPCDIDAYGDVIILISKKKGDPDEVLTDLSSLSVKCLTSHHKKNLALYLRDMAMGNSKYLSNRTLAKIDEVRNALINEGQERYRSRNINLTYDTQFVMRFLGVQEVPKRGMVFILRRRSSKVLSFGAYSRNETISTSNYFDYVHAKPYYKFDKRSANKGFLGKRLIDWVESNYCAALSSGVDREAQPIVSQTLSVMQKTALAPMHIFNAFVNGKKSKERFAFEAARSNIELREDDFSNMSLTQRYAWLYHLISNTDYHAEKIHSVIGENAEEAYRAYNITSKNAYSNIDIGELAQKKCLEADAEAAHFVMLNFEDDVCVPDEYMRKLDDRTVFGIGAEDGVAERFSMKDLFENPRCVRFSTRNKIGVDKRWDNGYDHPNFVYYELNVGDNRETAMKSLWLQNTRFDNSDSKGIVKDLPLYLYWGMCVTGEPIAGEHELSARLDYMYSLFKFLYFGEIEKRGMTYKNFKRFIRQEKDRAFSDILVSKMKKAGIELCDEKYVKRKVEQIIVEQCFLSLSKDNCNPSALKQALNYSGYGYPTFLHQTRTRLGKDGVAYTVGGCTGSYSSEFYTSGMATMGGKNEACCNGYEAYFAGRMIGAVYTARQNPSRSSIVSWIREAITAGFFPIYDGNRAFWFDGIRGEITNILYERAKVSE